MKLLFVALAVLILAVSAALLASKDPGYILIDVNGWTLETTVVLMLVFLALVFAGLYYTIRLLVNTFHVRRDLRRWHRQRQMRKANESLTHGLVQLAEGNWADAEKRLLKFTQQDSSAMLNYLAAARAAQEQGAFDRRDKYLKLAHQDMPSADIAVGLTQAELQLNQKQLEQALATLRHLQQLAPQHKKVLKALAALYGKLSDWQHLVDMMPDLRKRQVYPVERLEQMERMAHVELLGQAGNVSEPALQAAWYRIPRTVQENEEILTTYLYQLQKQGKTDIAEPLIRNALRRGWSEPLIHLYGVIDAADVKSQLTYAESLLKTRENNAMLLLTLGRLYLKAALWGKARACLEASINASGHPEAYNELGHLLEKTGEPDKAIECYRKGLANTPGCERTVSIPTAHAAIENKPSASALISETPVIVG